MAAVEQHFDFLLQEQEQVFSPPSSVPDGSSPEFVSSPDNTGFDLGHVKTETYYYPDQSYGYQNFVLEEQQPLATPSMIGGHTYYQDIPQVPNESAYSHPLTEDSLLAQQVAGGSKAGSVEPEKKSKVTAKRAEQNRQAQKTFRERKLKYVKDLEDRLAEAAKQSMTAELLKQENEDLRGVILSLKQENERLRTEKSRNFVWDPEKSLPLLNRTPSAMAAADSFATAAQSRTLSLNFTDKGLEDGSSSTWDLDAVLGQDTLGSEFLSTTSTTTTTTVSDGVVPSIPTPLDTAGLSNLIGSSLLPNTNPKRSLEEAKMYNNYTSLSLLTPIFSKDEDANKDDLETQLCDLLKKIHCKDKNPANCQGAKFVKKSN